MDNSMYDEEQSIQLELPRKRMVTLFPIIVALAIIGLEIFVAFLDLILIAVNKSNQLSSYFQYSKGVLSASVIQFHLTWGMILTMALQFVENSLKWLLNRKSCNLFGSLSGTFCGLFIAFCIYTWLWANDAAGITFVCKYFLLSAGIRTSPDIIKQYIYNGTIQYIINLGVSWLFPIQCVIVLIDCILSLCRKQGQRFINLLVSSDQYGRIVCMVDPYSVK